ncbi:MAG: MoaD/ThiS family protein [Acidobacteriia bacterium]|nr:MoaD/ThiS family protein [Terriglobia bacterium]
MKVNIPGPLRSYTRNASQVSAEGATLEDLLHNLDEQFPGMRFRMIDEQDRIRPHIKLFVNTDLTTTLQQRLAAGDEIHIICALSGGTGFDAASV